MDDRIPYRSDIDGLRCISVLSVIAFHYGSWWLSGGFVGVDVFFVISGYLITSRIYKDVKSGSFSVLVFYDRRMRRILPATLMIIILSLVAGYALLIPSDYVRLADSAMASSVGLANVYFLMHSGYFDPAHDSLPLLHLWSLGVEEQYYLIWPLLLAALARWSGNSKKLIIGVLSLLMLASFAASVSVVHKDQPQAFYMLYTRAWELALGALIVFLPEISSPILAAGAGAAGLALISYAIFTLSAWSIFPSFNALAPCLGAALLVAPKVRAEIVGRVLSLPPLVFVGKTSFSLYLWHWPLFVFYKIYNLGRTPRHGELIVLASASLALSALSYFYIERPFRKFRPNPAWTVASGLAAISGAFVLSSGVAIAEGFPNRFTPDVLKFYAYEARPMVPAKYDACFLSSRDQGDTSRFNPKDCIALSSRKPNVLIIGDSHAAQFVEPLRVAFPDISFSQVTASGCTPVLPLSGAVRCTRLMEYAFNDFLREYTFDDVILSGAWDEESVARIRSTIETLSHKARHITVFGPSIEYLQPEPLLLGKAAELREPSLLASSSNREATARMSSRMGQMLQGTGAQFLSVIDAECEHESCLETTKGGVPMLFDRDHFTFEGATVVLKGLKDEGLFSWKHHAPGLASQTAVSR